eukprot:150038_1
MYLLLLLTMCLLLITTPSLAELYSDGYCYCYKTADMTAEAASAVAVASRTTCELSAMVYSIAESTEGETEIAKCWNKCHGLSPTQYYSMAECIETLHGSCDCWWCSAKLRATAADRCKSVQLPATEVSSKGGCWEACYTRYTNTDQQPKFVYTNEGMCLKDTGCTEAQSRQETLPAKGLFAVASSAHMELMDQYYYDAEVEAAREELALKRLRRERARVGVSSPRRKQKRSKYQHRS